MTTDTKTVTEASWAPAQERPAAPLAVAAQAPAQQSPPVQLAAQLGSRPNLAAALVQAVKACQAVSHDARVEFGATRYNYASSEAILTEARKALSDNGLVVVPLEQTVNGSEREGPDRFELTQKRLLLHTSGECVVCTSAWPIIPDKGRALDKATAAADTLSLAYFLRDLLQMPRVDPADEVNRRDDSGREAPARGKSKAPGASAAAGGVITDEQHAELSALLQQFGDQAPDLLAKVCRRDKIGELRQLPAAKFDGLKAWLEGKLPRPQAPAGTTTPAAQPAAAPSSAAGAAGAAAASSASGSTPLASIADCLAIDEKLKKKDKLWSAAFDYFGFTPPAGWKEPANEQEVAAIARFLPRALAERIERACEPKTKSKKAPSAA